MTGVWNEGEMSPGGREMATSSGEREERRPGLMTKIRNKIPENHIVGFFKNLFANYGGK